MTVRGMDVNARGDMVARIARTDLPGDIFLIPGAASAGLSEKASIPGRLTHVNDSLLSTLRLGEVREERWESEPGVEVEGFVHLPPDYEPGRRYPLLLRPHGGPVSQYSHSFNFDAHLFAANGYVVLTPNPRGSSGYGQEFSAALWADWGNPDFKDVMAGVDHLIGLGIADGDRMGVGGWSYGGILTNYVITQTDRFKGAISGASEVLYIANYGHDHYQRQWEAELGLPWEGDNRENWERISPFNKVDQVTTPTLIMGGEVDWNVPIQNSEQLYQALRRRGVPTQLVVYPGQSHGIGPVSYRRDRHQRYLEWYDRWVKGAERRPVS
jgi:dipeptidyl aminopeptidase/acylaminoacyl peptidase